MGVVSIGQEFVAEGYFFINPTLHSEGAIGAILSASSLMPIGVALS